MFLLTWGFQKDQLNLNVKQCDLFFHRATNQVFLLYFDSGVLSSPNSSKTLFSMSPVSTVSVAKDVHR